MKISQTFGEQCKEVLMRHQDVMFGYLFGSQVKGTNNKKSDIDVAFYLRESLNEAQTSRLRLKLIDALAQKLRSDKIDTVVLNNVSLVLAFTIIKEGNILMSRQEDLRIQFEARTMSRFYDQKYYYDRHARLALAQLAKKGFG